MPGTHQSIQSEGVICPRLLTICACMLHSEELLQLSKQQDIKNIRTLNRGVLICHHATVGNIF